MPSGWTLTLGLQRSKISALLPWFEQATLRAAAGLAIHPGVDPMPVTEVLRQATPLAAVFGHMGIRALQLRIRQMDVSPVLFWKAVHSGVDIWIFLCSTYHLNECPFTENYHAE